MQMQGLNGNSNHRNEMKYVLKVKKKVSVIPRANKW